MIIREAVSQALRSYSYAARLSEGLHATRLRQRLERRQLIVGLEVSTNCRFWVSTEAGASANSSTSGGEAEKASSSYPTERGTSVARATCRKATSESVNYGPPIESRDHPADVCGTNSESSVTICYLEA